MLSTKTSRPGTIEMLPDMAKGILLMWLSEGPLDGRLLLSRGSQCNHKGLYKGKATGQSQSRRCDNRFRGQSDAFEKEAINKPKDVGGL